MIDERTGDGIAKGANVGVIRAASWLRLAAAPTFGAMALIAGVLDSAHSNAFCPGPVATSPLGGMAVMYLLMSAFHSPCWFDLISRRRPNPLEGGCNHAESRPAYDY